jgi:hypothetical protein
MKNFSLHRFYVLILLTSMLAATAVAQQQMQFSKSLLSESGGMTADDDSLKNSAVNMSEQRGGLQHILYSLVLPGLGELAMGNAKMAKVFFGSEAVLLLSLWGAESYIDILQNDLEAFAALNAGVYAKNKNDQYWVDVGTAMSLAEFNHRKLLERDLEALYPETPEYQWQWETNEERVQYVEKRFSRLDWRRRANWIVGGLVLNRLVSAIDVVRLLRKQSGQNAERQSVIYMDYQNNYAGAELYRINLGIMF